eukprot:TRINITY_DN5514_c0_g1_i15.p2 TRINITY_DN5514_c0_g1~~TRINITY_DN5514_c0_g1_i15.p2  ORF type:complete len:139 (+),score=39.46 TRINITY_DN5514_c0_g1_i15:104-520(+)
MLGELESYLQDFNAAEPFTPFNHPKKSVRNLPVKAQVLECSRNADKPLFKIRNFKSQRLFHTVHDKEKENKAMNQSKNLYSNYLEYFVKLLVKFRHVESNARGNEEAEKLKSLGRKIVNTVKEPVSYTHLTLPTICSV